MGKVYRDLRKTVRRAREGPLEDLSRRPKNSPRRIQTDFEQLILSEAKRTGYGPMRLSKLLWRKYHPGDLPQQHKGHFEKAQEKALGVLGS